ncbi:hypothetical protein PLESTB_001113500 [Pleodorina starrii]|uniref:Uncharacterized protein n=1 Tax=Pleodorina starrii TaxID=330485 RepID=A0A9W6BRB4_9CHLO|nr:hypothetical protein PLESTB_001113500 [Pleodorina starrii]
MPPEALKEDAMVITTYKGGQSPHRLSSDPEPDDSTQDTGRLPLHSPPPPGSADLDSLHGLQIVEVLAELHDIPYNRHDDEDEEDEDDEDDDVERGKLLPEGCACGREASRGGTRQS